MTPGVGTAINVATVLAGGTVGVLVGARLPLRVREVVTDGLGLVTLVVAGLNAYALTDPDLTTAVGAGVGVLVVLGSVVVGGIIGAALRVEQRLEGLGGWIQGHWPGRQGEHHFVEGFVTASLIFCVGPLTILGTLQDGLGEGIELLALKSVLDGFAALAFAASLGWGVVASAFTVLVVQGGLTLLSVGLGEVLSEAMVSAITATGGVLLIGVALRLLQLKPVPVGDLLPALAIAPLLTVVATTING